MPEALPPDAVAKVARLARLAITPEQAASYGHDLSSILAYADRLAELDLEGVEPLATPLDLPAPLRGDEPGAALGAEDVMRMAPARHEPFIRVPKVLGDGGGA